MIMLVKYCKKLFDLKITNWKIFFNLHKEKYTVLFLCFNGYLLILTTIFVAKAVSKSCLSI